MRIKTTSDVGDAHRVGRRWGVSTLGIHAVVIVRSGAMRSSVKNRVSDVGMCVRKVMHVGVSIHVLKLRWIYAVVIVRCRNIAKMRNRRPKNAMRLPSVLEAIANKHKNVV